MLQIWLWYGRMNFIRGGIELSCECPRNSRQKAPLGCQRTHLTLVGQMLSSTPVLSLVSQRPRMQSPPLVLRAVEKLEEVGVPKITIGRIVKGISTLRGWRWLRDVPATCRRTYTNRLTYRTDDSHHSTSSQSISSDNQHIRHDSSLFAMRGARRGLTILGREPRIDKVYQEIGPRSFVY